MMHNGRLKIGEMCGAQSLRFDDNYLRTKAFDQDGHQQVEQDVVAERHEGNEIQCGPVACLFHPVEQHHVPILLR